MPGISAFVPAPNYTYAILPHWMRETRRLVALNLTEGLQSRGGAIVPEGRGISVPGFGNSTLGIRIRAQTKGVGPHAAKERFKLSQVVH